MLSSTYRRSDLIESLHDGSWFGDLAKYWIFLPNGLILLFLWVSGLYLFWIPFGAKRKKKRKQKELSDRARTKDEERKAQGEGEVTI